jgi:hypothetical protein
MAEVIAETTTADHDGDVVVFLIGMRINRWRSVRHWVPVVLAFLPMIRELLADPNSGCRSVRTFFSGRTILTVQYWDSAEQVIAYARDPEAKHRPAWRNFNRNAGQSAAVGIFHETYSVPSGHYETVYRAMPPFGLANATNSVAPVARRGITARDRLAALGPQASGQVSRPPHSVPGAGCPADQATAGLAHGCPATASREAASQEAVSSEAVSSEAVRSDAGSSTAGRSAADRSEAVSSAAHCADGGWHSQPDAAATSNRRLATTGSR